MSNNDGKENIQGDYRSPFADNLSNRSYFAYVLTGEARENTLRRLSGAFLLGSLRKMRAMCLVVTTYRRLFLRQYGRSTALYGVATVGEGILMPAVTRTLSRRGRLSPTGGLQVPERHPVTTSSRLALPMSTHYGEPEAHFR
jgi:hypothetical protein